MNRRQMIAGLSGLFGYSVVQALTIKPASMVPILKPKSEWKSLLPADRYRVLFEEDTEPSGSSTLNHEKRAGTYVCAACHQPLFQSTVKYDSGTGWPSFYDAIAGALEKKKDFALVWPRVEYHCARCGGHQGHVFKDGPKPTGLRYCNNGLALRFTPEHEPQLELRK